MATDDFNRVDAGTLGANWATPASTDAFQVSLNKAQPPTGTSVFAWTYRSAESFTNDQSSQATISIDTLSYLGVSVRAATDGSAKGYFAGSYNGSYEIRKLTDAATAAALLTGLGTPLAGDVLYLEVTGSAPAHLVFKVNGVTVGTVDDSSSPYTSGAPGLFGYAAAMQADDWTGADVGGGGGGTPPVGGMDGPFRAFVMRPREYPMSLRMAPYQNPLTSVLRSQDKQFAAAGQWKAYDYPNPRAREYPSALRTHVAPMPLNLLNQDRQFAAAGQWKPYDYPTPKRPWYPDSLRFASGSFPALLTQAAPFTPVDTSLPVVRAPHPVSLRTSLAGGSLGAAVQPFSPPDWPLPLVRTYPHALRTFLAYYVQDTTVAAPRVQTDWPLPKGRAYPTELRFLKGLAAVAIPIVPLPPQAAGWDMPVPKQAPYPIELRTLLGRPAVIIALVPPAPASWDWPLPLRRWFPDALRTWSNPGPNLPMQLPQTPFVQRDWPLPRRAWYPDALRTFLRTTRLGLVFRPVWALNATKILGARKNPKQVIR